jgi:predicted ABC-type transport system involved in lysophospholipase L1 biosynthesis ATPase subunit
VLARTRVPVLAVPPTHGRRARMRPPARWPSGRVVAPLALDRTSRASAARAARVAGRLGLGLTLVHAVAPLQVPPFMGGGVLRQQREALARGRLTIARIARSIRGASVRTLVAPGYPADVIAAVAERPGYSLVIVTLDPRGVRFSARPGRISYHVLQQGAAPVLALPAEWR